MTSVRLAPLAILLGGCVVHISNDTDTIEFDEPVSGIVTDLGAGSVVITGAQTSGAVIYRDLTWSGEQQPEVSAVVEDGILYLSADCGHKAVCQANHEVVVSEDIWADISTGSGDVELRALDQGARVETGSGNITTSSVYGNIIAETGSGDLSIEDGVGDLELSTGSGNVRVQDAQVERLSLSTGSGDIEVEITAELTDGDVSTGSGDVALSVPAGSYALDISTGSGDVELSGITDSAASDRRLQISTGSGDVEVHGE